jgi:hypothetical protein
MKAMVEADQFPGAQTAELVCLWSRAEKEKGSAVRDMPREVTSTFDTWRTTGQTRDRTRPMLQLGQKVLAKAPSTRDP